MIKYFCWSYFFFSLSHTPFRLRKRRFPGGLCLQSFHPWVRKIPWRREWWPTPVFLPGEFHGQRSLEGYSSWGHKGSDTTERLTLSVIYIHIFSKSLGQCFCYNNCLTGVGKYKLKSCKQILWLIYSILHTGTYSIWSGVKKSTATGRQIWNSKRALN